MLEVIQPDNKEHWLSMRAQDITSTEISALFGLSPYSTHYELWYRKKENLVLQIEENERMKWGNRLEAAIAHGIAEDNGWKVEPLKCYMRDSSLRMGSSFDFAIEPDGILEIKNVDSLAFKEGWITDDDCDEAPTHIELQVQHQLALSGRSFAYIGALVGGNRVKLIRREPNEKIISKIKRKIAEFWQSIDDNKPPSPDFKNDSQFISSLYNYADPGKVYDASADVEIITLAEKYRLAGEDEKEAKERKDEAKAKILMQVSDAEKVISDMFTISAGMIGPAKVEYTRDGYRTFRIHWRKAKKQ